jgi:hypothetical protein
MLIDTVEAEDEMNEMRTSTPRGAGFYFALLTGFVILCGAIVLTMRGLPGLQNSPSASVDGKSVVGKTGN